MALGLKSYRMVVTRWNVCAGINSVIAAVCKEQHVAALPGVIYFGRMSSTRGLLGARYKQPNLMKQAMLISRGIFSNARSENNVIVNKTQFSGNAKTWIPSPTVLHGCLLPSPVLPHSKCSPSRLKWCCSTIYNAQSATFGILGNLFRMVDFNYAGQPPTFTLFMIHGVIIAFFVGLATFGHALAEYEFAIHVALPIQGRRTFAGMEYTGAIPSRWLVILGLHALEDTGAIPSHWFVILGLYA